MSKTKIGWDIDGVLASFVPAFTKIAHEMFGTRIAEEHEATSWNFDWLGLSKEQVDAVWRKIRETENFWGTLPPYLLPETYSRIGALAEAYPTYFITSRIQTAGALVELQTQRWLKWKAGIDEANVIVSSRKGDCCRGVGVTHYLDDKFTNCLDILKGSPGTQVFMLLREHNKVFMDLCPEYFRERGGIIPLLNVEQYLTVVEHSILKEGASVNGR